MNDDLVPIAALNHFAYCPHRCWRMFCLGEFSDNTYTLEGSQAHSRVHTTGDNQRDGVHQYRNLWLRSERWGLIGKADLVEQDGQTWYPIEYKRRHHEHTTNDALQLCGQALCLEDLTQTTITQGYLYDTTTHQRHPIALDAQLRQTTVNAIAAVRSLLLGGSAPPALYSAKCRGCSLFDACLPRAAAKIAIYREVT